MVTKSNRSQAGAPPPVIGAHAHAHVVINPRDMTPKQRAQLKAVLLSIERGQDDKEADDGGDDQAAG